MIDNCMYKLYKDRYMDRYIDSCIDKGVSALNPS